MKSYRSYTKDEMLKLTAEDIEALRQTHQQHIDEQQAKKSAYWAVGKQILAGIEQLWPTKPGTLATKWKKKHHPVYNYMDKKLLEHCPYVPNISDFNIWVTSVKTMQEKAEIEAKRARIASELKAQRDKLDVLAIQLATKRDWLNVRCVRDFVQQVHDTDKYASLALDLQAQRNDWSDGFDTARSAVNSFKVENDTDQEIVTELGEILEWVSDGREFRDCEWNYDRIMELADAELVNELRSLEIW